MKTHCEVCGGAIASHKRKTAVYCSRLCRSRAAHVRASMVRKHYDAAYRERKATGMTKKERDEMIARLERSAITAQHLRELQPVTQQWQHVISPALGAEYNIY
jgi:hypothetical protein